MQGRHWGTLPSHAEQNPRSTCGVGALLLRSRVAILKYCTRALTLSPRLGTHKMSKRGTGAGAGADPRDLLKKRDFERSPSLSINSQRRLRAQQKVWQESCAAPHVHLREVDGPVVVGVGSGQHLLHLLVTAQTYRRADKRAGGHAHARTRTAGRQVGRGARTHLRTPYMPSDRDNTPPPSAPSTRAHILQPTQTLAIARWALRGDGVRGRRWHGGTPPAGMSEPKRAAVGEAPRPKAKT